MIGWSKHDRWYYGSRIAKGCSPSDLWKTYFTSSKYVTEFRKQFGEPDVIEVRKVFEDQKECVKWEYNVLKRLKVLDTDRWLNKAIGYNVDPQITSSALMGNTHRVGKKLSSEHIEAIKQANRGRIHSEDTKNKMSEAQKGRPKSPEHKAKLRRPKSPEHRAILQARFREFNKTPHNKGQISVLRGSKFYNNGKIQKMFHEKEAPEGWVKGRLYASST